MKRKPALATDLYEITMAAAYFDNRSDRRATFELFVRRLPPNRNYLVVSGLEHALEYLETLRFDQEDVDYLRAHPAFGHVHPGFFDYLLDFRFTGDVWAMPEGAVAFANEPLLQVTAPLIEAQVVETFLLSAYNFQTLIASKAARVAQAAGGRAVLEFGGRRAHGSEAALLGARAAFIGGCVGTSNVEAGLLFGIPTMGTIAHAFIMSHNDELEAFQNYLRRFPDNATLLIDTYDTLEAVRKIISAGLKPSAVRLDSGDLGALSKEVRRLLDEGGLTDTKITASSDLDEFRIAELLAEGAPIDSFGVGTQMATSYDAPALGGVYKLVEIEEDGAMQGRIKQSKDKASYPLRKQVWRTFEEDVVGVADETMEGEPLLEQVMQGGQRLREPPPLSESRARALQSIERLPAALRSLTQKGDYPVRFSDRLQAEADRLRQ